MQQQRDGFVFRTYARLPIRTSMLYVGKDFAGQGLVRELSRSGCRILGNYPVTPGETISIRISHPTHPDPLVIKQVKVRWVKGFEFGVIFGPFERREADRLHQMLEDFRESGSYSDVPSPLPNREARVI
jgi:PilZ domain